MSFVWRRVKGAAPKDFDWLVVLIAVNPEKQPLFTVEERLDFINQAAGHLGNVSSDFTEGAVVEYARQKGARFLVRGIRGATDADYETYLADLNRICAPEISTLFFPADPELAEVSSSRLKEMAGSGEDGSGFCSSDVWRALLNRIAPRIVHCSKEVNHGL
jgi:pantetheine-phosphate adenylyltransferase